MCSALTSQSWFGHNLVPGARFTNVFLPAIQIWWKLRLAVIPLLAIRSRQIFAHATTCTKFCSDHSIRLEMRVKRNFHRIWNAMEKPLVKRGPVPYHDAQSFEWSHCERSHLLIMACWQGLDMCISVDRLSDMPVALCYFTWTGAITHK